MVLLFVYGNILRELFVSLVILGVFLLVFWSFEGCVCLVGDLGRLFGDRVSDFGCVFCFFVRDVVYGIFNKVYCKVLD